MYAIGRLATQGGRGGGLNLMDALGHKLLMPQFSSKRLGALKQAKLNFLNKLSTFYSQEEITQATPTWHQCHKMLLTLTESIKRPVTVKIQ